MADRVLEIPWFLRSRGRLLATLFAVLAVPLGGLAVAISSMVAARLQNEAVEQNRSEATLAAQAVKSHFDWTLRYVESFAQRLALADAAAARDVPAARAHLREMVDRSGCLDRAFLTDATGVEWCDAPEDPSVLGRSFAQRDWFQGASHTGRPYLSEVYRRAAEPRRFVVAAAAPVRALAGDVVGYLVGQQSLRDVARPVEDAHSGSEGSIRLVDPRGHVAVEPSPGEEEPLDVSKHPGFLGPVTGVVSRRGPEIVTGEESLTTLAPVEPHGWVVTASQPLHAVLEPVRAIEVGVAVATAALLVLLVVLGFVWLETVRRKHEAVVRLQEAKDLLLGTIVHDLRNPLTAILGSLELARKTRGASDPADDLLARAEESATRLSSMTQTLLDVGRMEDGRMPLALESCDLGRLVRDKAREYEAPARRKGATIEVVVPEGPLLATADGAVVARVVENLLTNAIKHTPQGGRITLLVEEAGADAVRLRVTDTGEGIAADQIPRIFTKYGRASGQAMGSRADTGLGLVFCRMALDLHGGTIGVESEVGRGATFTVVLPRRPRAPQGGPRPA